MSEAINESDDILRLADFAVASAVARLTSPAALVLVVVQAFKMVTDSLRNARARLSTKAGSLQLAFPAQAVERDLMTLSREFLRSSRLLEVLFCISDTNCSISASLIVRASLKSRELDLLLYAEEVQGSL